MKKKQMILAGLALLLVFGAARLARRQGHSESTATATANDEAGIKFWTCSMHPQIHQPGPGRCPICGMDLIPVREDQQDQGGGASLQLSPAAVKLAEVEVAPVERRWVTTEIRLVGKVMYDETRIRDVVVLTEGIVERLYLNYPGERVKAGEHIGDFYSPEVLTAGKELVIARDASRTGGGSALLDSARRKLQLLGVSDDQVEAMAKSGDVGKTFTVYSPVDGVLKMLGGYQGQWLERGGMLAQIADLSVVWVVLDAYESDLPFIRYGQQVKFTVEGLPGRRFTGSVSFIPPELDDMTRTVKIRLNVPNADGELKPAMFVRAVVEAQVAEDGTVIHPEMGGKWISPMHPEIVKDHPGTCDVCGMPLVPAESLGLVPSNRLEAPLAIPATAPLLTGRRAVVYVETGEGRYEGREVTLGSRAGDSYVVLSGLAEGERVVVNGNVKIDSALQILAKPSMMNPQPPAAQSGPQTHCPIMGGKIDRKVFADHGGYRVYFCCPACEPEFRKDPEKYIREMQAKGVTLDKTPEDAP
jgi:membrane fusion protein, copper/silver efflux system